MAGLAIHVLLCLRSKDVDARDKPAHDAPSGDAHQCTTEKPKLSAWLPILSMVSVSR